MFDRKSLAAFVVFSFMAVSSPSMADSLSVAIGGSQVDAEASLDISGISVSVGDKVKEASLHVASSWDEPSFSFISRVELMAEYMHDEIWALSGSAIYDFDPSPALNMYLGLGIGTYYFDGISDDTARDIVDSLGGRIEYETQVLHLGAKALLGFSAPISSSYDLDVRLEYVLMTEETHFKYTHSALGITAEYEIDPTMLSMRIGLLF